MPTTSRKSVAIRVSVDESGIGSFLAHLDVSGPDVSDQVTIENGSLTALLDEMQQFLFKLIPRIAKEVKLYCTAECIRHIVTNEATHAEAKAADWRTWRFVPGMRPGEAVCPIHRASTEPLPTF